MSGDIINRELLNSKYRLQNSVKNREKYRSVMNQKIEDLSSIKNIYQSGMTKEDREVLGTELSKKIYRKTIDLYSEKDTSFVSLFSNNREEDETDIFSSSFSENFLKNKSNKKKREEEGKEKIKLKRKPIFESEKTSFYFFENRIKSKKTADIFKSFLFLDKKEVIERQSNPLELYRYIREKHSRTDILTIVNKI